LVFSMEIGNILQKPNNMQHNLQFRFMNDI
jgi:hypothetical protein